MVVLRYGALSSWVELGAASLKPSFRYCLGYLPLLESILRPILCAILLFPYTALAALATIIVARFSRAAATWIMRAWAKGMLAAIGIRLEIEGQQHVDPSKPAVYMSNHSSMIDILLLAAALPVHLRFLYKSSLTFVPFVGQAIWLMGMIPINRGNRQKSIKSLRRAGDLIRTGLHLLVFPEGTRSKDGKLLPFKKGGFILAIQEKLDIVPITLCNANKLCGRSSIFAKAGTIKVIIHPHLSASDYSISQRAELTEKVRAQILQTHV